MISHDDYLKAKKIVDEYESSNPDCIVESAPSWLTEDVKAIVKELWGMPNLDNSNPRVKAINFLLIEAKKSGNEIGIKTAHEIIKKHCI